MSSKTTLSNEGQLPIPAEILSRHAWKAGEELVLLETETGVLVKRPSRMEDVMGLTRGANTQNVRDRNDRY